MWSAPANVSKQGSVVRKTMWLPIKINISQCFYLNLNNLFSYFKHLKDVIVLIFFFKYLLVSK